MHAFELNLLADHQSTSDKWILISKRRYNRFQLVDGVIRCFFFYFHSSHFIAYSFFFLPLIYQYSFMNYYNYKYIHLLFITELLPNDEKKLNSLKRKITTIFFVFFFLFYVLVLVDQRVRRGANYGRVNSLVYKWKRIYGVEKFMMQKWFCNWGPDLQCIFSHNLFCLGKRKSWEQ